MANSARERSTCAAGALSERLRRVSSWRSSAASGRRGSFWERDMGHLGARGSPRHDTRSHGSRPTSGLMNESRIGAVTGCKRSWWPIDGGAMEHLSRAHDWSTTPLGPIDTWPQSLKTAIDICLASSEAASVLWGREQIQLYNDAYIAIAQDRHPAIIGRPALE